MISVIRIYLLLANSSNASKENVHGNVPNLSLEKRALRDLKQILQYK